MWLSPHSECNCVRGETRCLLVQMSRALAMARSKERDSEQRAELSKELLVFYEVPTRLGPIEFIRVLTKRCQSQINIPCSNTPHHLQQKLIVIEDMRWFSLHSIMCSNPQGLSQELMIMWGLDTNGWIRPCSGHYLSESNTPSIFMINICNLMLDINVLRRVSYLLFTS